MIVISKINNLLFFNVESLINGVSYGLTSYVYDFIFIKLNLVSSTIIFKIFLFFIFGKKSKMSLKARPEG